MKYFMLVFALMLFVGAAYAQQEAVFQIVADINSAPLAVTATDMAVGPLYQGQTIGFSPVGAGDGTTDVSMGVNSGGITAVCTATIVDILGDPNARVSVEFSLPTLLVSATDAISGGIHVTYNSTSAIIDQAAAGAAGAGVGTYFNPLNGCNLYLDGASGEAFVELAGIFTVEAGSMPSDDYSGQGIVTVSYLAN